MDRFLIEHREDLLDRCREKIALRAGKAIPPHQLARGIPLFIDQLARTLQADDAGESKESVDISGPPGGETGALSEIGVGARAYGKALVDLGYMVDDVVHDYGDLCQAITDLGAERRIPFTVEHYRTLNRCLDTAIADAVAGFVQQADAATALQNATAENERLGFIVHELRNYLQTATMAFSALEAGKLAVGGSTAGLVKRSLGSLAALLDASISNVRLDALQPKSERFSIAILLADARATALLYASTSGCQLTVPPVDPMLAVDGNRVLIAGALVNLLQNAFKYTRPQTNVVLSAYPRDGRVLIDVQDQCGGLPPGMAEKLFEPFTQAGDDRSGLGLGLSIARRSVEADRGVLSVRDRPGSGCIFTIDLPRAETS